MQTNNVRGYPTSRQTVGCQRVAVPLLATHDDRLEPCAVTNFRGCFQQIGPQVHMVHSLTLWELKSTTVTLVRETTTTSS